MQIYFWFRVTLMQYWLFNLTTKGSLLVQLIEQPGKPIWTYLFHRNEYWTMGKTFYVIQDFTERTHLNYFIGRCPFLY